MDNVNGIDILRVELQTITLKPNEVLLVKLPVGTSREVVRGWVDKLKSCLDSQNILVYTGDNIDFLKIALEEKLIDKLIDDEIQK